MKELLLMRHAKSSWAIANQPDFERTLNERGKKDAPEMANRIKAKGFTPELIICSPAKRTLKTAKEVVRVLQLKEHQLETNESIYDAHVDDIMHIIRQIDDTYKRVMLVGHNPTFTGMVGVLTQSFIENIPTAGVALISFYQAISWKQVLPQTGKLLWFDYPKSEA
jgi:phosphohistidine phosphatase